jgi:hypothetical protein
MAERARVTSVDALDAFRSNLILYLSKARPTLEEVSSDVMRTRVWLEEEQRTYWQNQLRVRSRALEEAQQELFSARISNLRDESAAEVLAFRRAKQQVEAAQAKLRVIKIWARDFDYRVQPLLKQVEKLHTVLSNDLVKAAAYLAQAIKTLDAYADVAPPPQTGPAPEAGPDVSPEAEPADAGAPQTQGGVK